MAPSPNHNIKILHLNIRGLRNRSKFIEFTKTIQKEKLDPDIIILTETWLPENSAVSYGIEGYYKLSCGRKTLAIGGGILIFIGNHLRIERMQDIEMPDHISENIILRISNTIPRVIISAMYRPPDGNLQTFEDELYNQLNGMRHKSAIVAGDINIDWFSKKSQGVKQILRSVGWENKIDKVTRPASGTNLDHLYTNVLTTDVKILDFNLSDHKAFMGSMRVEVTPKKKQGSPVDLVKLKEALQKETWKDLGTTPSVSKAFEIFHNILQKTSEASKMIRQNQEKPSQNRALLPYLTPEIANKMKERDCLLKKYRRQKKRNEKSVLTKYLQFKYKQMRNQCVSLLKKAEVNYNGEQLKNSIKSGMSPWKTLKRIQHEDKASLPARIKEGTVYVEGSERARILNEFFTSSANHR